MLDVKNLSAGYGGEFVVRNISFHVREGEHLCILGPNGCGKTTLLRSVAGLIPCQGVVSMGGKDLRGVSAKERARRMALMSQISTVSFDYTVYETVMMGRYAHQKGGILSAVSEADRRAVEDSMLLSGVWELKDRYVTELSGGQLQRVFLARTFAQEPQAILLDEPTNHLDLRYQVELLDSLRAWSTQGDRCVVGVLHDINLALAFADTVLLIDHGEMQTYESIENFDLAELNDLYGMDVRAYMQNNLRRWI